jgi:acyl carrier protein
MDVITKTIIKIAKKLQNIDLTEDDIKNGLRFDTLNIDSIDKLEILIFIEDDIRGMELPDFDKLDLQDLNELWNYLYEYLPDKYKNKI